MHRLDLGGQRGVFPFQVRRPAITCSVEGGTGDLQQLARPLDIAPLRLLRLDERVAVHRVSFAKKAVVRFRISASSRSLRFSLRSSANSRCSSLARPRPAASRRPTPPASPIRAPRSRSGQSPSRPSRPTGPALAQLNDLRLELRRERTALPGGLFPMLSMIGHSSGAKPLMLDVRQSGSGPHVARPRMARQE
jgi:hypothetical protein